MATVNAQLRLGEDVTCLGWSDDSMWLLAGVFLATAAVGTYTEHRYAAGPRLAVDETFRQAQ